MLFIKEREEVLNSWKSSLSTLDPTPGLLEFVAKSLSASSISWLILSFGDFIIYRIEISFDGFNIFIIHVIPINVRSF